MIFVLMTSLDGGALRSVAGIIFAGGCAVRVDCTCARRDASLSRMRHGQDPIAVVERGHRHADLSAEIERVTQRLDVLEPASAQYVLLGRHAMLGRLLA